jgi:hypothetical protein
VAQIDLGGADAQRIRGQYQTSLGRDASDDEVSGWLGGSYGGGGVDNWLQQIDSSGEAQQRRQPRTVGQNPNVSGPMNPTPPSGPAPSPGYGTPESGYGPGGVNNPAYGGAPSAVTPSAMTRTLEWWQGQGVGHGDIFDLQTGQIKPGWKRTREGYERTSGTTGGGAQSFPNGDPFAFITSLTNGKPPTPESLEAIAPELAKYGITIGSKGNRGWSDTITLPDGRMYDLIEGAGVGTGKRWQFLQVGGPGYVPTGGVGGGQLPGNQYSDPYTQMLEELIKSRIGNLQGGYDDSMRQQYQQALQQRADSLGRGNAQIDQLMTYLQSRFKDLQGPGYTGAENEVIRTAALDPIENDRSAARQRALERLSARGLDPNSGIAQQVLLEVDKAFDEMRAMNQTALATNELARREDRQGRAQLIGAQLADIPDARSREQLDVFSMLENLQLLSRNEDQARSREAISYGGVLSDMGPQRLQLAMQAAGMGGNPQGLASTLLGIGSLNQNASAMNMQNGNSLASGLGTLMAILSRQRQSGLTSAGR